MYYQKFIAFLKKHNLYNEEILNYWKENRTVFDYLDEDSREFIGCYYLTENNILKKIKLIVPFFNDDKTVLINIHEYIHLMLIYPYLNKKYKIEIDKEVLPIYYEKLFIKENKNNELEEYSKFLDDFIIKNNKDEYKLALKISNILLQEKETNIYKGEKRVKKLIKKFDK